jgi:hypothetical protein
LPKGCDRLWPRHAISSAWIIAGTAQTFLHLPGFVSEYLEMVVRQLHA